MAEQKWWQDITWVHMVQDRVGIIINNKHLVKPLLDVVLQTDYILTETVKPKKMVGNV